MLLGRLWQILRRRLAWHHRRPAWDVDDFGLVFGSVLVGGVGRLGVAGAVAVMLPVLGDHTGAFDAPVVFAVDSVGKGAQQSHKMITSSITRSAGASVCGGTLALRYYTALG